jgi:hypothetical protein
MPYGTSYHTGQSPPVLCTDHVKDLSLTSISSNSHVSPSVACDCEAHPQEGPHISLDWLERGPSHLQAMTYWIHPGRWYI